jgi:hypothetical protein
MSRLNVERSVSSTHPHDTWRSRGSISQQIQNDGMLSLTKTLTSRKTMACGWKRRWQLEAADEAPQNIV